jgi:ABC-type transport system substrate-binding protein
MKKTIIWVAIALGAVATTYGIWCRYTNAVATEFSVMVDITDKMERPFDRRELTEILAKRDGGWGLTTISMQTISNVDYNKVFISFLPEAFPLFANPEERKAQIVSFHKSLAIAIDSVLTINTGREKSSIYLPIIREANRLGKSSTKNKTLIVYSDLAENGELFSTYRSSDITKLKNHPEKILHQFETLGKPGNLHGLTIHLVYQPTGSKDNEVFKIMATLLKKEFEQAGAEVYVAASLITYN